MEIITKIIKCLVLVVVALHTIGTNQQMNQRQSLQHNALRKSDTFMYICQATIHKGPTVWPLCKAYTWQTQQTCVKLLIQSKQPTGPQITGPGHLRNHNRYQLHRCLQFYILTSWNITSSRGCDFVLYCLFCIAFLCLDLAWQWVRKLGCTGL